VTTIAVSRSLLMMAADGNMTVDDRMHRSDPKIWRTREFIVGYAGTDDDIRRLAAWLKTRTGKMPKGDRTALILYRDGLIGWIDSGENYEFLVPEDHFAIGTGATHAIAAMDALEMMGLPVDPRLGVSVACRRDPNSGDPVQSMRWKPTK
jgi:ATP-dependent protease HslVU (ClpYQ) peptidase subunit